MKTDRLLLKDKEEFATVTPRCPYVGTCGGCTMQDLAYEDQIRLKTQRLLRVLGPLDPTLTVEVVPMDDPWRYRNKAELTFSQPPPPKPAAVAASCPAATLPRPTGPRSPDQPAPPAEPSLVLGYHAARSFWRIVDLDDCWLLPEPMTRLMRDARDLARRSGAPAYNPKSHRGFFRYLTIRASRATGRLLVVLTTTPGDRQVVEAMADALQAAHPAIASLYWGINAKVADVAIPDELALLRGEPYLDDRLGPFAISLHPMNFLQPNPAQAERLYARLAQLLSDVPSAAAWDLYSGVGLVAFYLASKFQTVYAIDVDANNLELAQRNAQRNGITNVQFRLGRAEDVLENKRFWLQEAKPEAVVVDPPRSGLHPKVIASLLAARPKQLVYVSCNAVSLARDLQELLNGFPRYRLCQTVAFDLFPHTNHLEVLTLLERA